LKEFFYGLRKSGSYRDFCLALSSRKGLFDENYLDALEAVNEEIGSFIAEIMYKNWKTAHLTS